MFAVIDNERHNVVVKLHHKIHNS